jgi:hypothetical protein
MSNRTSCIAHAPSQILIMIREDYLILCDGDHCAAALLNYFEHWHDSKIDEQKQRDIEIEIAAQRGEVIARSELWVYASTEKIVEDLMALYKKDKVQSAIDWLVEVGFISRRNNPRFGWDRTWQYLFNPDFVNNALLSVTELIGEKPSMQERKIANALKKNRQAIPKTSSSKSSSKTTTSRARKAKRVTTPIPDVPADVVVQYEELISPMMDDPAKKTLAGLIELFTAAWVKDAFTELKRKCETTTIENPFGYLVGILRSWRATGKPIPRSEPVVPDTSAYHRGAMSSMLRGE